ncbi:MAG: ATP synthase subunit I [Bryobacteraceae bacterium]
MTIPEDRPPAGAGGRLNKLILALAVGGTFVAGWWRGWPAAAGFALGAAVSWGNFRWLERTVRRLGQKRSSAAMSVLAGLRYAILGLGAYVILKFSKISLPAALAGLFVSVAAVLTETIIQLWYAGSPRNLDH